MKKLGKFKCTRCKHIFDWAPNSPRRGWYIICPKGCYQKIEYDNHPNFKSSHKYFKRLNYERFQIKR